MKRFLLYTCLILQVQACRVYPSMSSNTGPFITIDDTYDYYIREYYVEEENERYELRSKQQPAISSSKKLIEVEYLFVSNDGSDNVLYLTTVPDRRQMRYSENYLGSDSINMHDVRMLHLGKMTGNNKDSFLFVDFKSANRDTWHIQRIGTSAIKVHTILNVKNNELNQMMIVDSALANPVIFEKVPSFHLVYYDPKKKDAAIAGVDKNRLYYHDGEHNEIIVYYDKELPEGKNVQRFPKKQIVYDPQRIFGIK